MPLVPMRTLTLIATTGDRFTDFGPYVASVNDAGVVAFQAGVAGDGSGVFTGDGRDRVEVVERAAVAAVTSHPDIDGAGAVSFYGETRSGVHGVFLARDDGLVTIGDTRTFFASIGPTGPSMDEAGTVAFRAETENGVSGVFLGSTEGVVTVALAGKRWCGFQGVPVVTPDGAVLFRADRGGGVEGVHLWRAGSVETIAETGDVFGAIGRFPSVNAAGTVAFAAMLRGGGAGVFTSSEGRIERVLDTDGAFESFRGAIVDDRGRVVLIATPRYGSLGLFDGPDPEADRIVAIGDPLHDSTVTDLAANPVSVNAGGQLAVRISLADGRQQILRADPESRAERLGSSRLRTAC